MLTDRTTFAVASSPSPDGIKVDISGNVWTGALLGFVAIDGGATDFALVEEDEGQTVILYVMNETRLIHADISM